MARVLVTDGHQRSALAIVRSLGRAGHECYVVAPELPSWAAASKHCHASASLDLSEMTAVERLVRLIAAWRIDFLIPVSDDANLVLAAVAPSRQIGSARVLAPEPDAYHLLSDKVALHYRATGLGLTVPRSVTASSPAEAEAAGRSIGFPCVLKPHRSTVLDGSRTRHFYVRIAETPSELAELALHLPSAAYPVLVQERIAGAGEGVFLLADGVRVRASFAHRRIREYPPSGGASTYRESIPVAPDLLELSTRLLDSVGWEGVAMVEFKRSSADGNAYLMEVNGRFWGSLQLAIDAGLDFPKLLLQMAGNEPLPDHHPYRCGVKTRWLWGDLDYLFARLRLSSEALHLSDEDKKKGRLRVALEVARIRRGEHLEEFQWSDPGPFLFETRRQLRRLVRRLGPAPTRGKAPVARDPEARPG